ncbi:MAG: hypothetical protein M1308_16870 [Actinobacteria bacterium]|nr:hypothetical protein [Actinomycetota bacterium]
MVVRAPYNIVTFTTTGLSSGTPVAIKCKMFYPNNTTSSRTLTGTAAGGSWNPIGNIQVPSGTQIFINWPIDITYNGAYYKIGAAQWYVTADAIGGSMSLNADYYMHYSTNIVVSSSSAMFGSDIVLTAILTTANRSGVANQNILFYLNSVYVGTAVTDSAGVATMTYDINSSNIIDIGTYPNYITASFSGGGLFIMSEGKGLLEIYGEAPTQQPSQQQGAVGVEQ